jgi:hypothetical protein
MRTVPPSNYEISVKKGYEKLFNSITYTTAFMAAYCIRLAGVAEMQGHKHIQTAHMIMFPLSPTYHAR